MVDAVGSVEALYDFEASLLISTYALLLGCRVSGCDTAMVRCGERGVAVNIHEIQSLSVLIPSCHRCRMIPWGRRPSVQPAQKQRCWLYMQAILSKSGV